MRMPNLRASRLLRCQETWIAALAIAVIASVLMLVTSATDRETSSESALVTVAPATSGKAHPKSVPASAVPFTSRITSAVGVSSAGRAATCTEISGS